MQKLHEWVCFGCDLCVHKEIISSLRSFTNLRVIWSSPSPQTPTTWTAWWQKFIAYRWTFHACGAFRRFLTTFLSDHFPFSNHKSRKLNRKTKANRKTETFRYHYKAKMGTHERCFSKYFWELRFLVRDSFSSSVYIVVVTETHSSDFVLVQIERHHFVNVIWMIRSLLKSVHPTGSWIFFWREDRRVALRTQCICSILTGKSRHFRAKLLVNKSYIERARGLGSWRKRGGQDPYKILLFLKSKRVIFRNSFAYF